MKQLTKRRWARGATMVEYALMVALIALAIVAALLALGQQVGFTFETVTSWMQKP